MFIGWKAISHEVSAHVVAALGHAQLRQLHPPVHGSGAGEQGASL